MIVYLCAAQLAQAIVLTTNNPMGTARLAHSATLLLNGKVLVTGGITTGPTTNTCELYDPATGTWTNTGSMSIGHNQHTATLLLNGKVLVAGGSAASGVTNICELYDPVTGTWSLTGSLGASRNQHTATLLPSGKILVAGGQGLSAVLSSVEIYDPATGVWTTTNSLAGARHSHTATLLTNGLVLIAGGNNGSGYLQSSEIFNPGSGTWSASGTMASARFRHTATLLPNGKVLVATGGNGVFLSTSELFNPATGTWTAIAVAMSGAHADSSAVLLPSGKVLLAGGFSTANTPTAIAETYDPVANAWSATTSLVTARYYNTLTLMANGKVLVAGGTTGSATTSTELYDVTSPSWALTNALVTARTAPAATLLPNGKVLVAGGQTGSGVTNTSEIFDPTNGTWTASGSLAASRSQHTVTLLASGKVLAAGGFNGSNPTNGAELFDFTAGTWAGTSPLNTARYAHTATALADGRVLVAGGQGLAGAIANAELYNPAGGTWTNTGSLTVARRNHTATLLPNGKILVAGGTNNITGNLASAELYDSSAGTWSVTAALGAARNLHTATLLPNGKILVAGGISGTVTNGAELYNPASGTWTNTGAMTVARHSHTATLLPNGKVLVSGGFGSAGATNSSEVYDPAFGTWSATGSLTNARYGHIAAFLPNGKVLVAGGQGASAITNSAELFDLGLGYTNSWQPQITNFTSSLALGTSLVLGGSQFRGISESGGGSMLDSACDYPVVQLRSVEGGQVLSLVSTNWNTNSFTSLTVTTNFPQGYALATMFVNGIPGTASLIVIAKQLASLTLNNLAQTYDGTGKSVGAITAPSGLAVSVTYNGSATAPTNAGSYTVVGTINDLTYQGGATNTLVVSKAAGFVILSDLSKTYDGTAKPVTNYFTSPGTFAVNITYDGSASAPTNAGTYTVIGTINDPNYSGSTTNTLTISKANATVTLTNLVQTYSGTSKTATVITTPQGLAVDVTYNGSTSSPTNVGSYGVNATINDPNYQGFAGDTLVINKATAAVTLGNLLQTYDGTPKSVTVTTTPANLTVFVNYDGTPMTPTTAGSYTVIATVSDSNYQGAATNTLVIAKAPAAVTLGNLAQTYDGTAKSVSASTAPTNLTVNVTYNGSASPPTNAGSYTVVGLINDTNYQGSATNTLTIAKIPGTVTLGSLSQVYNGSARNATATTTPSGLTVTFTYNGSASAPTNAGSYMVVGTISDVNYFGAATNTLLVSQAAATVTLGSLAQIYDGTARIATASTTPGGLTVGFTYSGSPSAPTNAGSYTVVGTVSDVNYFGGATNTLVVSKAAATVTLGSLAQTYDGTARIVTATTTPSGLTVNLTYNGSASAPTNAGSYTVAGIISDANYFGGATNALVISKAIGTVTLGSLAQTYDGTARNVSVTTSPTNLTVNTTYNGSSSAPTNAGSYTVVGTINDANYVGGATNTLIVSKASATVTLGNLAQTYNGSARTATATTTPNGLTVNLAYNGSASAPTNAGSYTVVGTISDVNYFGGATNALIVSQAPATVTLGSLAQTYDGTARNVSVTTSPTNLAVNFTYNGVTGAPINAGSYTVVGTISDVNYFGGATNTLVVSKAPATVTLGSLTQTYDGTARIATATTTPNGLFMGFTYNGSASAPTNAGSYSVIGTVSDANYFGGATNTLVVSKAAAAVALGSLAQTYDGTARIATATTTPNGLTVGFTYNGSPSAPTNAGSYTVIGTISDVNYFGGATNTLIVSKAGATVTLGSLAQTYDGTARIANSITTPNGLTVGFTYNGSPSAPTNAGSYSVIGTVSDINYFGAATNTLIVGKAAATVALGSLAQTYDGTARTATASTTPNGLTVSFTYNGSASVPTNAGSYVVVGTVSDINYSGSATNTLAVSKGAASVTLGSLAQTYDGTARTATAATAPPGLIVNFAYNGSANAPTNAGSYTVVGTISDVNYFGGATNTLIVSKAAATVALGGLAQTYNGSARTATATTTPNGLTVNFTYNGLTAAPTNAGSYTVVGAINDVNYFGGATNTLVVSKAAAAVALGNLAQTYDGTARTATATTTPTGLSVTLAYNGSASAPVNAGSYTVVGIISDANYFGGATNTLSIAQAAAVVTFSNLSQTYDGTAKTALVTTAPTNLTVSVTYNGLTNGPANIGSYTVIGIITEANYQGSATNTLTINCPVITVGPASLPGAALNAPYSQTNTASGGSLLPYTFVLASGSLPGGLTLSTNGLLSGTPTAGGTFNFTVMVQDANGCIGSRAYTLLVVTPPFIAVPPLSQTILPGATASLSVTAGGTGPLAYQWMLNGTNIAGATGSSLTLTNVSGADAGHYTVTVSNAGGSVTSSYAIVTVWGMNFYPVVTVFGKTGDQYRVDYVDELDATNWNTLGYVTLPFSPYFVVDTNSPNSNKRFYRVVLP